MHLSLHSNKILAVAPEIKNEKSNRKPLLLY